jgi:hypothetical protein
MHILRHLCGNIIVVNKYLCRVILYQLPRVHQLLNDQFGAWRKNYFVLVFVEYAIVSIWAFQQEF